MREAKAARLWRLHFTDIVSWTKKTPLSQILNQTPTKGNKQTGKGEGLWGVRP